MVDDALSVLVNLEHRGGKGLERNTGDGAGILFQVPHRFFRKEAQKWGHLLPNEGDYGVAMVFFPQEEDGVRVAKRIFEDGCAAEGLPVLFWREVPVDAHDLGATARRCMPTILQCFVTRPSSVAPGDEFERKLFVCRRSIEQRAAREYALQDKIFYICSMSARTIVYKGMLVATQMRRFFRDLDDANIESSIALVHSRYSTNTTPSWERAHPNRLIIHNGEINTLRGNVNWIRAREPNLYSPVLGSDLTKVLPIINAEGSDSAILDNVLEFLMMNNMPLARAVTLLMPEPWDHNPELSDKRRAYDAYQSMLMEPWDGPAAIAFSNGNGLGAALDRNGLRPARYCVTRDDRFILSSEVGTIDIEPENLLQTGCLGPGELLFVDQAQGRVVWNDEIRNSYASQKPFYDWIDAETLSVEDLPLPQAASGMQTQTAGGVQQQAAGGIQTQAASGIQMQAANGTQPESNPDAEISLTQRMARMGHHYDDVDEILRPMAETGSTPIASMGQDIPLPVLSKQVRSFYDYFNQLFAQVTNPPIDALRESLVTSQVLYIGNHGNLLVDARDSCRLIRLEGPMLSRDDFERIAHIQHEGFRAERFFATYQQDAGVATLRAGTGGPNGGAGALQAALTALNERVEQAVRQGTNIVIISDRAADDEIAIPSLLALGSVHNHLIKTGTRMLADIVLECGDALSAHDYATLVSYSASGIFPYLAYDYIDEMVANGTLELSCEEAERNYAQAATDGIVSIMSKMGISTMQGYHSAQVFEIVGLGEEIVSSCFTGTNSRIGGLSFMQLQKLLARRRAHAEAICSSASPNQLTSSGITKWRPISGEEHLLDPEAIYWLQRSVREGDFELFRRYSEHVHRPNRAVVLRDLLDFVPQHEAIDLDEVEPAAEIVKRFNTGAMSYGSISKEAHECLAIAMNRLGGRFNSGEGGENPTRETRLPNGDSKNSAIKQVASGRFGVTSRYLSSAIELQIKMAQGAKPGEGGHLPGLKVWPWVAEIRNSTPGVGLISPPPHHDIYSIEDLSELIFDLRNANPDARVSVKLVSEAGIGTIASGVAKGGAGKILVSGHNGGTGAAPRDSIYHAGLPLELGLAETQQTLLLNGLRSRVVLEADGKLLDGRDVCIAALLGAEEFGFATLPLVALGCLMQRDCHQDTCPVGICTQSQCLRSHFAGKPEYVENFMLFVAEDLRRYMAKLGYRTVEEMVGHTECLKQIAIEDNDAANSCDLSPLLVQVEPTYGAAVPGADVGHFLPEMAYDADLHATLDATLFIPLTQTTREHMTPTHFQVDVDNVNRCVGTMLGSVVTKQHPEGLPDGTITIDCVGSGGQSFGAFLPAGITLNVEGDANDYFGKGLSGGILSVRPPAASTYKFDENASIGNVAFYGATAGRGFVNGLAGQRFGVRNSGATLVVEGVGNHGCEYMTGGTALILGEVGQNFAAGMSGGIAYVYDEFGTLVARCNKEMVELTEPSENDFATIRTLLEEHVARTQSPRGIRMLYQFNDIRTRFVKVIPHEYRLMMMRTQAEERAGYGHEAAIERAFESIRREK